jgi:RNA polymerase sigma-70 factor (ECF subfamily)
MIEAHMIATVSQPVRPSDSRDEAIPRLMKEHGGKIYHLALRLCGKPEEAEDVVQDTFLQAYRKWGQFRGDANPGTWLYTIAARRCRRLHRRRSGEPKHIASLDAMLPATGPVPDLPARLDSPLATQIKNEAIAHVEQALIELPITFRMPLVLKDIVGFSIEDVANVLGIKPATVKTRLHRARLMIRHRLQAHLPTKEAPPPAYEKQVCMDLLLAKQEALDNGVEFPMSSEDFCQRCAAVFASMDLAAAVCQQMGTAALPPHVESAVVKRIDGRKP